MLVGMRAASPMDSLAEGYCVFSTAEVQLKAGTNEPKSIIHVIKAFDGHAQGVK